SSSRPANFFSYILFSIPCTTVLYDSAKKRCVQTRLEAAARFSTNQKIYIMIRLFSILVLREPRRLGCHFIFWAIFDPIGYWLLGYKMEVRFKSFQPNF